VGAWPRNACRGRVHSRDRGWEVREGELADRWGPQASEGERANRRSTLTERAHRIAIEDGRVRERIGTNRSVPLGSGRERGREGVCTVIDDRWGPPPVRRRGCTRLGWAGLGLMG
jgi:hypothetical protein